ncbi:MAG: glutamate-cysteine ligase family protein [Nocardioides sp.]
MIANRRAGLMGFRFGIEAEYLLIPASGVGTQHGGDSWDDSWDDQDRHQRVVDGLPDLADPDLTRGDLAIKQKRWYVEGDERFDAQGRFIRCVAKGIETRTPIRESITAAVTALAEQTRVLGHAVEVAGHRLAAIGHHPWRDTYRPDPAYSRWELDMRAERREYAAPEVYMLTYGPDLNLSHSEWTPARCLAAGARLAEYAPGLVAFTLNAPYRAGRRWRGDSARVYARAGRRPNVRVFLDRVPDRLPRTPGLQVCRARIPAEHGRIEFKAFDAFADLALFGALGTLLAGVCMANGDQLRSARWPDRRSAIQRLRRTAIAGLADETVRSSSAALLDAAEDVLAEPERTLLDPLREILRTSTTPARALLRDSPDGPPPHLPRVHLSADPSPSSGRPVP